MRILQEQGSWQQRSSLRRLKRSDDDLKLPENFEIGQAIGGGDCFFDSVAKSLKQIKADEEFTVKLLRKACHKYALENEWVKTAVVNDARLKSGISSTIKDNDIWNAYLLGIRYTADDLEKMKDSNEQADKNLYKTLTRADYGETLVAPIWGRAEIEGRIFCEKYNVEIHVVEKHNIEEKEIWTNQVVDRLGSRSTESVDYSESNVIHIVNKGRLHFEPILDRQKIQSSRSLLSERKQVNTKRVRSKSGTYSASGLKHTLHGDVYQLKLLMLFLKRGLDKRYSFRLATEMDEAEKFDDLVFEYKKGDQKNYRFLQAMHKQDEFKKITTNDLLTETGGDFSLQKYFASYRKIKQKPEFKDSILEDFITCTNIDFRFDDVKGKLKLGDAFEKIKDSDDILEPVHNLFKSKAAKAKTTICKLVLSFLSQFFHSRLHLSSQAKDRSTTHLFGSTTNL